MVAEEIVAVYAGHPSVEAIILGGSVARGTAAAESDIDLGIFWKEIPQERGRGDLLSRLSGELHRTVDNSERYSSDNPRRQGLIEIIAVTAPDSTIWAVDVEHETVAGTDRVISEVVVDLNTSLERQELLSVIDTGIPLHGASLVGEWRERALYSDEFMDKVVCENLLGIGRKVLAAKRWGDREEWFGLQECLLDVARRLFLALMSLNRTWCYTDNVNFKGAGGVLSGLKLQPSKFVSRLGEIFHSDLGLSVSNCAQLSMEVLHLAKVHVADSRLDGEMEVLEKLDGRIEHD